MTADKANTLDELQAHLATVARSWKIGLTSAPVESEAWRCWMASMLTVEDAFDAMRRERRAEINCFSPRLRELSRDFDAAIEDARRYGV